MVTNLRLKLKLAGLVVSFACENNDTSNRFLNLSPSYLELSGNMPITALVVKQRVDACCKLAVGQVVTDTNSVHAKAQIISRAEVFYFINQVTIMYRFNMGARVLVVLRLIYLKCCV